MKKSFIAIALGILILLLVPVAGFAVTVSPPTIELDASGGETLHGIVKLYNETRETVTLSGVVQSFKAFDETGVPAFVPTGESTDLASWVKLDKTEIVLAPGEKKDVPFTVNIPTNAKSGGYFASILWSNGMIEGTSGESVGIIVKVGTLLLIRVSGDVNEVGQIASFTADNKFYNYLPVNFSVRFENTGDVHLKPTGAIQIRNMFGAQVASIPINEELANVLPNSIRRFETVWQKNEVSSAASEWRKEKENFAWGKYTAVLTLNYGADNQAAMGEIVFWVFPWRTTMFYGVPVIVIILFIIIQGVKGYNERIIKKSGGKAAQ